MQYLIEDFIKNYKAKLEVENDFNSFLKEKIESLCREFNEKDVVKACCQIYYRFDVDDLEKVKEAIEDAEGEFYDEFRMYEEVEENLNKAFFERMLALM